MRLRISQRATTQCAVLALVISAVNLVLLAIIAFQLTTVLNRYADYVEAGDGRTIRRDRPTE